MWSLSDWESLARSAICLRYVAPCSLVLLLIIVFSGWTYSSLWHFSYYSLLLQMSIVEQALSAAFFHSNIIILLGKWGWRVICNLIWLSNNDTASFSVLRRADNDRVIWVTAYHFVLALLLWLTRKNGLLGWDSMAKAFLSLMFELAILQITMVIVQIWLKFI